MCRVCPPRAIREAAPPGSRRTPRGRGRRIALRPSSRQEAGGQGGALCAVVPTAEGCDQHRTAQLSGDSRCGGARRSEESTSGPPGLRGRLDDTRLCGLAPAETRGPHEPDRERDQGGPDRRGERHVDQDHRHGSSFRHCVLPDSIWTRSRTRAAQPSSSSPRAVRRGGASAPSRMRNPIPNAAAQPNVDVERVLQVAEAPDIRAARVRARRRDECAGDEQRDPDREEAQGEPADRAGYRRVGPAVRERARLERDHDRETEHGQREKEVAHDRKRMEVEDDRETAERDLRDRSERNDSGHRTTPTCADRRPGGRPARSRRRE